MLHHEQIHNKCLYIVLECFTTCEGFVTIFSIEKFSEIFVDFLVVIIFELLMGFLSIFLSHFDKRFHSFVPKLVVLDDI